uniref:Secreted protein n=1 Tax=Steinernema glaseri TaxID=37863 RepID=A0A1I7Z2I1_9BILA
MYFLIILLLALQGGSTLPAFMLYQRAHNLNHLDRPATSDSKTPLKPLIICCLLGKGDARQAAIRLIYGGLWRAIRKVQVNHESSCLVH